MGSVAKRRHFERHTMTDRQPLDKVVGCDVVYVLMYCLWCGELTRDGSARRVSKQSADSGNVASDEHSPPNLSLTMEKSDTVITSDTMSPESGDCSRLFQFLSDVHWPHMGLWYPFPAFFPSLSIYFLIFCFFFTFSLSFTRSLYLFSSFVHPFPFYQNSHHFVSRPEIIGGDRTWV